MEYVRWFAELKKDDLAIAGGKGANLGEMMKAGLPVPAGFVVTASAYHTFMDEAHLRRQILDIIAALDENDRHALEEAADRIQALIREAPIPSTVAEAVVQAYRELGRRESVEHPLVAARSSATMEDTAQASFAGMNRSFLNVQGEDELLTQVREVWASLYSPRVIFYRKKLRLEGEPEIAVIVQVMVNSEKSGVAFSVDPATGDASTVIIEAAPGLGEVVVGGQVEPDHYEVAKADLSLKSARVGHKAFMLTRDASGHTVRIDLSGEQADARVLTDAEIHAVAELVRKDESHYGTPQDIEWAMEGDRTYLVQSRPMTGLAAGKEPTAPSAGELKELVRGLGASPGRATGRVRVLHAPSEGDRLEPGNILVAEMTSPDWVPFMRRAAAIVTNSGGMTSHAAIVSRELGLPCVVGAHEATSTLIDGLTVTVDGGSGVVLEGRVETAEGPATATSAPVQSTAGPFGRLITATKLMVNLGEPELAEEIAARPVDGVGLLRAEFMLLSAFKGVHPRKLIAEGKSQEFVHRMTEQLETFARAFYPRPVVYRSTDFRTNEFRGLEGGEQFEPHEENPMIGFRGAFRYVKDPSLFRLELETIKQVRQLSTNLHLMIPFVRTESELRACKRLVDESGLTGERDFQLWVMAEVPSVIYWLDAYAHLGITGVSIGSNDLTQLMLGVDRDSEVLSELFDERDRAVTEAIRAIIAECHRLGLHSSICGQAPSVYPEYAEMLVRFGIDSVSVNPDAIDQTRYNIAAAEQRLILDRLRSEGLSPSP